MAPMRLCVYAGGLIFRNWPTCWSECLRGILVSTSRKIFRQEK